nr:hypothetical protein [uncultured bacterium]
MRYHVQEDSFLAPLPSETAEERLLGAVLLRAWRDLLDPRTEEGARLWFAERAPHLDDRYLSYAFVCEALDLDMEKLWDKIRQVISCDHVDTYLGKPPPAWEAHLDRGS